MILCSQGNNIMFLKNQPFQIKSMKKKGSKPLEV